MEAWRTAWRKHICPQFSPDDLGALALALEGWVGICQEQTTDPINTDSNRAQFCVCACPIAILASNKENVSTVGDVEKAFVAAAQAAGSEATHQFTNWFDSTPTETVRQELYAEVMLALGTPCHELPPLAPLELVF